MFDPSKSLKKILEPNINILDRKNNNMNNNYKNLIYDSHHEKIINIHKNNKGKIIKFYKPMKVLVIGNEEMWFGKKSDIFKIDTKIDPNTSFYLAWQNPKNKQTVFYWRDESKDGYEYEFYSVSTEIFNKNTRIIKKRKRYK